MGMGNSASVRPLRVMTFNISHGAGIDRRLDLARTARVIRAAAVDVAGLQEVARHFDAHSGFVDQAEWLARELDMHLAFGANLDRDPDSPGHPRRQFGNAILSVDPILDRDNTHLPRFGDHEQRGLLRARIEVRGVSWQIYTTHLQHNDAAERLAQARAISQLIGTPNHAVVLLGDLNAIPDTPEVRAITGSLVDTWQGSIGWLGYTAPNPVPYRRIDYVMRSPDGPARAGVITSLRARIASDHLPVVADLAPPADPGRPGTPV